MIQQGSLRGARELIEALHYSANEKISQVSYFKMVMRMYKPHDPLFVGKFIIGDFHIESI